MTSRARGRRLAWARAAAEGAARMEQAVGAVGAAAAAWRAAAALSALALMLMTAGPAEAAAPPGEAKMAHAPEPQPLREGRFCETPQPFATSGCSWQPVRIPHRWEPARPGLSWALYRFEVPHPGAGAYAVVAERLALDARVRVQGAAPATLGSAPGAGEGQGPALVRYWPQLYAFELPAPAPGEATPAYLRIEVALQGHGSVKSGIGALALAERDAARQWHWRETLLEVDLVLALSAATLMAGLAGLFAGAASSQPGRLLLAFAALAITAALRTAMNFVVSPPLPLEWWTTLSVWLLIVVALQTCTGIGLYLWPSVRRAVGPGLAAAAGSALLLAALPARALYSAAELMLGGVALVGVALLATLVVRVWRTREPLGTLLLVALALVLLFGVHDLALHLGPGSLSDRYLQKWSTPALVILMIALLARRVARHRALESALQRETASREELLRDLHDSVGSRLVALSFHARHQGSSPGLVDEIGGLIHELQVIQRAVRAGPTNLAALLADLRHLYARIGGGQLPLRWEVPDAAAAVPLTATQAVALLRIVEEAVTNAMKHAQPATVSLRVEPGPPGWAAEVCVLDDGPGAFKVGTHGGLHNMRFRAQRAGLGLELDGTPGAKAVRVRIPAPAPASTAWARLLRPLGRRLGHRLGRRPES